jgi:hypothetical protein
MRRQSLSSRQQRRETNLDLLSCALLDPSLAFLPALVQQAVADQYQYAAWIQGELQYSQQTSLSSPLDQLIRLDDELVREDPRGEGRVRGEGLGDGVVGDLAIQNARRSRQ